jgi:hypothetical protein
MVVAWLAMVASFWVKFAWGMVLFIGKSHLLIAETVFSYSYLQLELISQDLQRNKKGGDSVCLTNLSSLRTRFGISAHGPPGTVVVQP